MTLDAGPFLVKAVFSKGRFGLRHWGRFDSRAFWSIESGAVLAEGRFDWTPCILQL